MPGHGGLHRAAESGLFKPRWGLRDAVCTLVVAWRVFEGSPVVVAANRDEAADRPSSPPAHRSGSPGVVAPRDDRAGGTWIGYNEAGVFAGLSNRWTDAVLEGERSRGLLVGDALAERSADAAARAVESAVVEAEYDGYNLVVADAEAAVLVEWDGRLAVTELEPGVHVVMNAGYDDQFTTVRSRPDAAAAQAESAQRVREALHPRTGEGAADWLDRAAGVLGDHDYGVCVHGDGYGTRSSSLIRLGGDGSVEYRYADGPPCTTPFEPVRVGDIEGQS